MAKTVAKITTPLCADSPTRGAAGAITAPRSMKVRKERKMISQGHASSSFALKKVIALLIAVAAAGLGTTAAVAFGWTTIGTGAA